MRRLLTFLGACLLTALIIFAQVGLVFAHEDRTIAGKYDVEVGWYREPSFVNQANAAYIGVFKAGTKEAVLGVEKTLKVNVAFGGGAPKEFTLHAVEDEPGHYIADLTPTRTGSYIFTFVGDIEGAAINERFESGPGRFDDVDRADAVQFPQPLPDPLALQNEVKAARDEASTTRLIAIAGVVIGILGLAVGGVALRRR